VQTQHYSIQEACKQKKSTTTLNSTQNGHHTNFSQAVVGTENKKRIKIKTSPHLVQTA
jgi:hypothetical protein